MQAFLNFLKQAAANRFVPAILVAVIGIVVIKLVMKILKSTLNHLEPDSTKLITGVARPVLYILLGLIVATSLGIDVTSIVALASVLTLAISLSLQNALANIFGGFTLLNTRPFDTGDYVEIAGQAGTVKEIGMAYTRLATSDNKLVFIPNSAVVAAEIVNYSALGSRRMAFEISVDYNADPAAVTAALLEAAKDPRTMTDPAPFAALSGYKDGTTLYVLRVWASCDDYWDVYYEVAKNIKTAFAAHGIAMSCSFFNVNVNK